MVITAAREVQFQILLVHLSNNFRLINLLIRFVVTLKRFLLAIDEIDKANKHNTSGTALERHLLAVEHRLHEGKELGTVNFLVNKNQLFCGFL